MTQRAFLCGNTQERHMMKSEHQELARQSFVLASGLLEMAHEIAIAGQSPQLGTKTCISYARQLHKQAQELEAIAAFLEILAQQK